MKLITIATSIAALLLCTPMKAQTPEQWTQWGTVIHGGFRTMLCSRAENSRFLLT
jgi:hypothetical protein